MHDGRHDMCEECDRYYDAAQLELRKLKNRQPPTDTNSGSNDPHALPDVEVFELTASEVAKMMEEEIGEYLKRFPLATMNSRECERMFDTMIAELGITGGWFYAYLDGGLDCWSGGPYGPFENHKLALAAMREEATEAEALADTQELE